jgi:hypothetical protein
MELTGSSLSLLAAILAALLGTGSMTISSASEAAWTERGDSPAPGVAALWPFKVAFGLKVEGRLLYVISVWAHWGYGAAWGVLWWVLIDVAELNLAVTTVAFGAIVWVVAILNLKITGIAPWPWTWGLKYNIYDWTHHTMYVLGTLAGWVAIEQIAIHAAP